jgi:hypothetical protein
VILGHVQINIPQGHREVEDDGAGVEDKLEALATGHVGSHIEVPHGVAVEGRHSERAHRRLRTHNYTSFLHLKLTIKTDQHGGVVSPRQEEHARVVLLPVGHKEVEEDVPEAEVHAQRRDAVVGATERRVHARHDEHGRVRVQPVVEQLAQRAARLRAPRLLPVNAVCKKNTIIQPLRMSFNLSMRSSVNSH